MLAGATRGDSTVSLQSSEEKALRQQRARLEARMAILEDHNRQLEAQVFNKVSLKKNSLIVSSHLGEGSIYHFYKSAPKFQLPVYIQVI